MARVQRTEIDEMNNRRVALGLTPIPRSEIPEPRRSKNTTREKDASPRIRLSAGGFVHEASTVLISPNAKTRSIGPSPITWYAMWTPSTVVA